MLKGETIILYEFSGITLNELNEEIPVTETPTEVENVLWNTSSVDDITDSENMYGKVSKVTICIPKGDTHVWENRKIFIPSLNRFFRVYSQGLIGIESLIPLDWNAKYYCEYYE